MKRLLVLLISLFVLSIGLFAMPIYPNTVSNLPLANGHTLKLDFYAPKDALPFFDQTILANGFTKLLSDTKLSCDFSLVEVPTRSRDCIAKGRPPWQNRPDACVRKSPHPPVPSWNTVPAYHPE